MRKYPKEWTYLEAIQKIIHRENSRVQVAWGDDAFAFKSLPGYSVICQDMLVENVHFERSLSSAGDLGFKALAVNLSDIAAMGAFPHFVHVSLAIPPNISESWLDDFYKSMSELGDSTKCQIVGGDLTTHPESLIIDVNVFGSCSEEPLPIGQAEPGDVLLCSGSLGLSRVGFWALKNNQPGYEKSKTHHLRPPPRLDLVNELQTQRHFIKGLTDCSDGLLQDIYSFSDFKKTGAKILADELKIADDVFHYAQAMNLDPVDVVLAGGEDYELLLMVKQEHRHRFSSWQAVANFDDSGALQILQGGVERQPNHSLSWFHF